MSPAMRATLETVALLGFGIGLPLIGFFGPEWLFLFLIVAVFVFGVVMFWRAAYRCAQLKERNK